MGVVHEFGMLWKQRVFSCPLGSQSKMDKYMTSLLFYLLKLLSSNIHTKRTKPDYQGNAPADFHAKAAAREFVKVGAHVGKVHSASTKTDLLLPDLPS